VSDHDPFLSALADRPHDDTLRLVYADWLDEHGLPDHAAFLRLEVRLRRAERSQGWFGLCRAFLRAANATPDEWRELVSRPRLVGTTWRTGGGDNESLPEEELEFRPEGVLVYRVDGGDPTGAGGSPGTWRQFGPRVAVTINEFSVARGTVRRDLLNLCGRPLTGPAELYLWRWTLTRVPGPDCIPDLG